MYIMQSGHYSRTENNTETEINFGVKKCFKTCQRFQFPKSLSLITISAVVGDQRTIAGVLFIYLEKIHYLQHDLTRKQMYLCHCSDLSNKMNSRLKHLLIRVKPIPPKIDEGCTPV